MIESFSSLIKYLDWSTILQNFAAPGLGAWLGARYAFKYDRRIKEEEKLDNEIERSKFAQFVIISHIHFSKNVWNQYLEPQCSNKEKRHLNLKSFDFIEKVPSFDFEKLSFMLDEQDPNILYELFQHERRFLNFVDSIKTRNDFYNQFLSDQTESEDSKKFLKQLTDNMYQPYEHIDSKILNIDSENLKIFNHLLSYLEKRYPNTNFLSISVNNSSKTNQNHNDLLNWIATLRSR